MKRLTLLAGSLLAFAPILPAQQDAAPWFEKMGQLVGKAVEADMSLSANNQMGKVKASGHMSMGDQSHYAMDMALEIDASAMGMTEPMKMTQKIIADGKMLWVVMDNPMMGGQQVMKVSLDRVREMGQQMSMGMPGMGMQQGQMDFAAGVRQLQAMAEFHVASQDEKTVRLTGLLNEEGAQVFSKSGVDADEISVVLQKATGFPVEMRVGGAEEPAMLMRMSKVSFPEKVDLKAYRFTPPEGVTVMDLGVMMGAGSGEDGEF